MKTKNKNLLTCLNDALKEINKYKKVKYESILDFIMDDEKCAEFINDISFDTEKIYWINYKSLSVGRARHSVLAYLLGIVLGDFLNLYNMQINTLDSLATTYLYSSSIDVYKSINHLLWAIISQNHDYGYYLKVIDKKIDFESLSLKFDLLKDENNLNSRYLGNFSKEFNHVLKNSYSQILDYYEYSQELHKILDDEEKNDHGILGAVLLYNELSSEIFEEFNAIKDKKEISFSYGLTTLIHKVSCLTIAQHNIYKFSYKCDNEEIRKLQEKYKEKLSHLSPDGSYFIGIDNPCLFLLSIVDTIEIIKKFSKFERIENYLSIEVVLKNVDIYVTSNEICICYSKIYAIINSLSNVGIKKAFDNYIKNIEDLNEWTDLIIESDVDNLVLIIKNKKEIEIF